jgi:hypothetical protein
MPDRPENPFRAAGEWLRTQLHDHTIESDGELSPEEHVALYDSLGFDVVAVTDHWKVTRVASTSRMLVMTGAELAVDPLGPGRYTEILAIGIDHIPDDPGGDRRYWEPIDNYEFKTFPDLSAAAAEIGRQGGAAFVAHPYWSGLSPEVVIAAEGLTGLELFNASSEREDGRGDSSYVWDLALEAGRPLSAIATDDCHYPDTDYGAAWTMVRATERTSEGVLDALRAGRTYCSNGPAIVDIQRDGDDIEVRCSPAATVRFQSRHEVGWAARIDRGRNEHVRIVERDGDGRIVRARLVGPTDPPAEPYLRIVVEDAAGRRAWTNPI